MQQTQVSMRDIPRESKEKITHGEGDERSDWLSQRSCEISFLGDT